jgi:hypothetical protein
MRIQRVWLRTTQVCRLRWLRTHAPYAPQGRAGLPLSIFLKSINLKKYILLSFKRLVYTM